MAGKHAKQKRVEIVKGVGKGRKGKVVEIKKDDKYGDSYRIRTDEGTLLTPVDPNNTKDI